MTTALDQHGSSRGPTPATHSHRIARMETDGYLIVLPWDVSFVGGVNQVVLTLERELQLRAHVRPLILVSDWAFSQPTFDGSRPRLIRYRLREPGEPLRQPVAFFAWLATLPVTLLRLRRLLKSERVTAVNVHYPTLSSVPFAFLKAAGLTRARLVVSFHGQDAVLNARLRGGQRWLFRFLLARADAFTACSQGFADQVRELFPNECAAVEVVHNGVDPETIDAELKEATAAAKFPHGPYVLCVSSFVPKKALEVLVAGFAEARKKRPELYLVLVGRSGSTLVRIQCLLREYDLLDWVTLKLDASHGEVQRLMRGASIFVLPSREEPFGIVLLEAGLARLPVVATRVGGVPEIISSPDYGVLVSPDNPGELSEAMLSLLADEEKSRRLGNNLSIRVRSSFSANAMAARYLRIALSDQQQSAR